MTENTMPATRARTYECPYFDDGRMTTIEITDITQGLTERFHEFLGNGYRRYADFFYRNACAGCSECLPLRVELSLFHPSRSQRRALRKNADIRVYLARPSRLDEEKLALFTAYKQGKHPDGEAHDYLSEAANMHYGFPGTLELDFYQGERLVAVSIVDEAADSLSAVYFYYDLSLLKRRPGVFSALMEIACAKQMGKKYYYLGFTLEGKDKMSYKKFFRPNQVLGPEGWKDYMGVKPGGGV